MKLTTTLFLVFASTFLSAQFDLSGTVHNDSGEPLQGASIFLVSHDHATISDEKGNWILPNVDHGLYNLKCSYLGYKSVEIQVDVVDDEMINIVMVGNLFEIDEIVINGTQAEKNAPFAFYNMSGEEVKSTHIVQDIPFLLQQTPSAVATSDTGNGVGYTGLRIRGSDPTRINVTVNGVPINDSESQAVFWVNMPDFAVNAESIQIQRGIGTSTNGAGAFGGTVGINTNRLKVNPHANVNLGYGSFNTHKVGVDLGTGLMNDRYAVDFKYSSIGSDGYVDRANSDLSSWYFSGARISDNSLLRFLTFSGDERTYQSWNGVPKAKIDGDLIGLEEHYNRNPEMYPTASDSINLFDADRRYNLYEYEDQVDDYSQGHYHLMYMKGLDSGLKINTTLHYTRGKGFFEQFKHKESLDRYNISYPLDSVTMDTLKELDLVRRRWLDNHFYGGLVQVEKALGKGGLTLGAAAHNYIGDHYGTVIMTEVETDNNAFNRYYDNRGKKLDYNVFAKMDWTFAEKLSFYSDVQYRGVNYKIDGVDSDGVNITTDATYSFFNPKMGLSFAVNEANQLYASAAMGHREPDRNDFLSNLGAKPQAEEMLDFELGWRHKSASWSLEVNGYYMDYKNQLVLNGNVNDVGATLRTNVDESYRRGVELSASAVLFEKLQLRPSLTLSQNKIKNFTHRVYDYASESFIDQNFESTDISFSPSMILSNTLSYQIVNDLDVALLSRYVGKQYLDNTTDDAKSLDAYFVNDVRINYQWQNKFSKDMVVSLLANNIANAMYSSNGYTYSYAYTGETTTEVFLFPQAGFNAMLQVAVKF